MAESDSGPTGRELWEQRLEELYQTAVGRQMHWKEGHVRTPNPDVKGAVEVCRLALQLHGALQVGTHGADCKCRKCKGDMETAEAAVTRRLQKVAG